MLNMNIFIFLIVVTTNEISAVSFNQPKFPPTAAWRSRGVTFANQSIVGQYPPAIFINTNNKIYVANRDTNEILVWQQDSINPTKIISGNFSTPRSLFVTSNGDIYIDDDWEDGRVMKWVSSTNTWITVMNVNTACFSLFVDISGNLYCSMTYDHRVAKKSLHDSVMTSVVVAGTGISGSTSNELSRPFGLFVDENLDLYVADCGNDRVQLFRSGQSNGITIAGSRLTISLSCPSGVILDADKYLFIVEAGNNRIVGSGPNGFRCLVGCHGRGSQSNQLSAPFSFSFDHSGDMYVTDQGNHRIQKFEYLEKSPGVSFNQPKFPSTAAWNSNGITFANQSIVGQYPYPIFVNTNNTIYTVNRDTNMILVWHEDSINPAKTISGDFSTPDSIFVTPNEDIYIDDGRENWRVLKWISSINTFITVMHVNMACTGLFVDINENLYCSISGYHQVLKRWLHDSVTASIIVAGTGEEGSSLHQLNRPLGIFVDENLDLYVADCRNNRVQLFESGKLNGITIAGSRSTISLYCPSGVILDADKYLFIVDMFNNRIVGEGPNGFRCLVGCHGQGSHSNQLSAPFSFSFDRSGNMFVIDQSNNRIQKFEYMEKSRDDSFNQPQFCSTAAWNSNGITYANQSTIGQYPRAIFINTSNTIYVANQDTNAILVWHEGSITPTEVILGNFFHPASLFVTLSGDIYIDNGRENGRVLKWISSTNTWITVMNISSSCYGMFVDINENLYCSIPSHHQVVKRWLNDSGMTSVVAAGTGITGSASDELSGPLGIFVDKNLDLYVADCGNNRVQLFQSEKSNGITAAGSTSLNPTISLSCPSGVILDADRNLFIVDHWNDRIVGSGPNGFRCLVGCHGLGSQSNQLFEPFSFSFDHSGNMYVTDQGNHRIQKFVYLENSCDMSTTTTIGTPSVTVSRTVSYSTIHANRSTISTNVLPTTRTSLGITHIHSKYLLTILCLSLILTIY